FPSDEKTIPMKVEDTGMSVLLGLALRMFLNNVIENGVMPLFTVASVFPSGESAIPYGFGASALSSSPTGVINPPFCKTSPFIPSRVTVAPAGRVLGGAPKVIAFEPPAPGPFWPPATWISIGRLTATTRTAGRAIAAVEGNRRM